jgi:hypothetical protein
MKLIFSPIRRNDTLTLTRRGDCLTINGTAFDFTPLEDGQELPLAALETGPEARSETGSEAWFAGPVRRIDGQLELSMILPHGEEAPQEALFPQPLILTQDGPVPLPGSLPDPTQETAS